MNLRTLRIRTLAIILLLVSLLGVYSIHLFSKQIVHGDEYRSIGSIKTGVAPIPAARGMILDRNGVPMVTNQTSVSVIFENPFFPDGRDELGERNELLASLITLFEESGAEWIDMLPLALNANGLPYFIKDREKDVAEMKGKNFLKLNEYATAQNCMDELVDRYRLQDYDIVMARKIASVQYNMWRMAYKMGTPYTFAKDVSEDLKSKVRENSGFYRGVHTELVPARQYADGTVAPHILGRVAAINKEDYEKFKGTPEAYKITDEYGAAGIERAAEQYLRGKTGQKTIVVNRDTGEADEIVDKPAVQGGSVILTIDSALQKLIEKNFPKHLKEMEAKRFEGVPPAGAVIVMDVRSFEILACVSYPGYDISKYRVDFARLNADETAPLYNRALMGKYEPGSTSKVSVALAALQEGKLTPDFRLYCNGRYPFLDMVFNCPQVRLHKGKSVDVVRALVDSCNSFFYDMGRKLGYEKINDYRHAMGLGQKTGSELPEDAGIMESPEYRESLGQEWYQGNNLQTAIGQGNLFTPIQMAVYASTIANNGTRYRAHFLQSVRAAGSNEVVMSNAPEVLGNTGVEKKNYDIVKQAMLELGTSANTTAGRYLKDLPVKVAAKTGTSQVTRKINGKWEKVNNGIFISFAPYDNPEIAVIAVGEGCRSSEPVIPTVRDIYEYYFGSLQQMTRPQRENVLLS